MPGTDAQNQYEEYFETIIEEDVRAEGNNAIDLRIDSEAAGDLSKESFIEGNGQSLDEYSNYLINSQNIADLEITLDGLEGEIIAESRTSPLLSNEFKEDVLIDKDNSKEKENEYIYTVLEDIITNIRIDQR